MPFIESASLTEPGRICPMSGLDFLEYGSSYQFKKWKLVY